MFNNTDSDTKNSTLKESDQSHIFMGHFKLPYKSEILGEFGEVIGYKDEIGHVTVALKAFKKNKNSFIVAMDFCSPKDQFNRKRAGNVARARLVRPKQESYRFLIDLERNDKSCNLRDAFRVAFTLALALKRDNINTALKTSTTVDYVPSWAKRVLKRCLKEGKLPETTRKYKGPKVKVQVVSATS